MTRPRARGLFSSFCRAIDIIAAIVIVAGVTACGDDLADSSRFEVTYSIPASSEDVERLTAFVEYADPNQILASPSGTATTCRSFFYETVPTLDDGRGRVDIMYDGCPFDLDCSIGVEPAPDPDSDPSFAAQRSVSGGFDLQIFTCEFSIIGAAKDAYFDATVTEAYDGDSLPVPLPELSTRVRALSPPPPDAIPDDAVDYDVTAAISNETGLIGALQFDIDYLGESGGWRGSGASARCSWNVSGGISACNDVSAGRVRCALADISGFETPAEVVTCIFATDEPATPESFEVTVVDASSPYFQPVSVDMVISGVERR